MAYTKQTWNDLPDTTTPVNATRLNHMENGIKDNDTAISNKWGSANIKTKTINDTLNSYVNIDLDLNISNAIVLCVAGTTGNGESVYFIPFITSSGTWCAYTCVARSNAEYLQTTYQRVTSNSVTAVVYYLER